MRQIVLAVALPIIVHSTIIGMWIRKPIADQSRRRCRGGPTAATAT
jgi:hypothetical protein